MHKVKEIPRWSREVNESFKWSTKSRVINEIPSELAWLQVKQEEEIKDQVDIGGKKKRSPCLEGAQLANAHS